MSQSFRWWTVAGLCSFLLICGSARGQTTFSWIASGGGSYETPGNWVPLNGPPGISDTANFGISNTYIVNFTNGIAPNVYRTTDHFTVQNGNVTFNYSLSTANQRWNTLSTITPVGLATTATLTLTNTGSQGMTGNGLLVGTTAGKQGTFTVSTGGIWKDLGDITAGSGGSGAIIATGGGKITNVNSVLGDTNSSGIGTAVVNGAGSGWTSSGAMTLGNVSGSTGNLLVQNSGAVSVTGQLNIGNLGSGVATVNSGATLTNLDVGTLGNSFGSNGQMTVDGTNSVWNTGSLYVGNAGTGSLTISNGGKVNTTSASSSSFGYNPSGTGNVTVTGANSQLNFTNSASLLLGNNGIGSITVKQGGTVNGFYLRLGDVGGSGTVLVTDAGSSFNFANSGMDIGSDGSGLITVQNGGQAVSGTGGSFGTTLGYDSTGNGTLNIIGSGSQFSSKNMQVGVSGTGTVLVTNGGLLTSSTSTIGQLFGSTGMVTVTGLNSAWNITGSLSVGGDASSAGGTGTLNINNLGKTSVGTALNLWGGGTVNINNGTLSVQSMAFNGGTLNWNAGTIQFSQTTTLNDTLLSNLLGSAHTLSQNHTLATSAGTNFTLGSVLSVDGGRFTSGGSLTVASGQLLELKNGGQATAPTSVSNFGTIQMNGSTTQFNGGSIDNQGIITGTGRVNNTLSNNLTGQVRVGASDWLVFTGASHSSQGSVQLLGGTLEFTGFLNNGNAGFVSGFGSLLTSTGAQGGLGLVNTGTYAFSGGNTNIFGDVQNNVGGHIVTSGGSVTTFHDDVVHNGAEIRTSSGARTVFFGSVSGAGPYTGTGVVHYEGDLRPGNSPANVTYDGDIEFSSTAKLHIELGGTSPGSQYDRLTVAGSVTLAGLLDVQAINGFVPSIGQSFIIIDNLGINAINGTFTGLNQGDLFTSNGFEYQIDYRGNTGNDVVLTAFAAVPEPATWVMIALTGLSAAGYGWLRQRRHQRFLDSI